MPNVGEAAKGAASFVGKNKLWFIGGAVILVGGYAYTRIAAPPAQEASTGAVQTIPVSSGYVPVSSGGMSGGSYDLASGGSAGNSANMATDALTSSFQGAFGTYSGMMAETAAAFDLARQNIENSFKSTTYQQTIDANATTSAQNLDAYAMALGYGVNAGSSNNSVIMGMLNNGQTDPNAINSVLSNLYGNNPVVPGVNFNSPSYYNAGDQNVNKADAVAPLPVSATPAPPAIAYVAPPAPQHVYNSYTDYVMGEPDLKAYYTTNASRLVKDHIYNMEQFGAYHYAHNGMNEPRDRVVLS